GSVGTSDGPCTWVHFCMRSQAKLGSELQAKGVLSFPRSRVGMHTGDNAIEHWLREVNGRQAVTVGQGAAGYSVLEYSYSRRVCKNSSPKRFNLLSPTPEIANKALVVVGRCSSISRSVASWKITYGGTPCSSAKRLR